MGPDDRRRLRVRIEGAVQGVGFRPYIYRLATELDLAGRVLNDARGVTIEAEGPGPRLEAFLARLPDETPAIAAILELGHEWLEPDGLDGFEIESSDEAGEKIAVMLPDVATCPDCLGEILDRADRRFRYPFTNCTSCGPRFSIIASLPYDRPNTTMRGFTMCGSCRAEYEDVRHRRFHAQPNACPECGPRIALQDGDGHELAAGDGALSGARSAILDGRVLALKGLGGFHLVVDGRNDDAVRRLRRRKRRPTKPLAVMVRDVEAARRVGRLPPGAARLLASPQSPIVLIERRDDADLAESVAPGLRHVGVMLPYTPLHHLLLGELDVPVVATSGNLVDEPICTENREALERLSGIADLFLVHDRPIRRHVDDSVLWFVDGAAQPLRRARGYAPLPLALRRPAPPLLAVGAHQKNVVALASGTRVFLSQHIGDMETPEALRAFERVIRDFIDLYEAVPVAVAHDLHPDYPSTRWALRATEEHPGRRGAGERDEWTSVLAGARTIPVQHHHAHLAACLAEHAIDDEALGVTWDGTGYGTDGTVWGGEFLVGNAAGCRRAAHLRPFLLPGGEAAVREPRRVALALLWQVEGAAALERSDLAPVAGLSADEKTLFAKMLESGVRSPATSSVGRLFDGAAALIGLHQRATFEGEAAISLEEAADGSVRDAYPLPVEEPGDGATLVLDWRPLVGELLEDLRRGEAPGRMAARFHNALVEGIFSMAEAVGRPVVALTGGCFQNRLLTERAAARLRDGRFTVAIHRSVPANDGGISLGQVAVAAAVLAREPPGPARRASKPATRED